jgi:response regulator NasT
MTAARILLVDDDRLILATLGDGLRRLGYDVRVAPSGEAALTLCVDEAPDLAILDVSMPELGGVELAQRLREATEVPYLFLSAYSDRDIVQTAVTEGALGYLVKPLDVTQIAPAIEAALARAGEIRALRGREASLQGALTVSRETSTAVGVIMERYRLNRDQAFEALRFHARSQRRRIEEVADEILQATEHLGLPPQVLDRVRTPVARR